jgi:F-type H+-transporting ATPase subunit gamma
LPKKKIKFTLKRVAYSARNRKVIMSQLIQLKQRIKVIETIKKTTNAMRLISMSMHSRLRQKKGHVDEYVQEISKLYQMVGSLGYQEQLRGNKKLFIIIGSQKGLCGNFNTQIFNFFQREGISMPQSRDLIAIGKQIIDYLKIRNIALVQEYPEFSSLSFTAIATQLIHFIEQSTDYNQVVIFSNFPHTFFIQKSRKVQAYPLEQAPGDVPLSDYTWEQSPAEVVKTLQRMYLKATLEKVFFESLFAEQAARFISMDNATRNAEDLLKTMKLDYNKLRQANITRELTDLASSTQAS